jgi:hypothetical protein
VAQAEDSPRAYPRREPLANGTVKLVVGPNRPRLRVRQSDQNYTSEQNVPPTNILVDGNLALRYGGQDNDYDREVKCSFEIKADEKSQLKIDGKTYDLCQGRFVSDFRRRRRCASETNEPRSGYVTR